jgi:hypothetical protein
MERFDDFIRERQYLLNVSPQTIRWYSDVFTSWKRYGGEPKHWIVNMREAGVKPVSITSLITG